MLATVPAATLVGVIGRPVEVQVHVAAGLPSFSMVGMPDASCREARDRVRAAMVSSGMRWPQQRVTVNLSPPDLPKLGTALDLAIAVGLLAAIDEVPASALDACFLAELGLDGSLRPVRGVVPLVAACRAIRPSVVVAPAAGVDAAIVPDIRVRTASMLADVVACLRGDAAWDAVVPTVPTPLPGPTLDVADVRGQPLAVHALEVAAAGRHHLLLSGPPGAGKSMLARRLPGLLPDLDDGDALEATAIASTGDARPIGGLVRRPPFRAPHHTASAVALIGGGSPGLRPGEITRACHGVLFCDELGEFAPTVIDAMRQPLEEGVVRIDRARASATFPARFQLVAATNPCPCGPAPSGCRCSGPARARYARRLSGPLLDRFDLRVRVERPDAAVVVGTAPGSRAGPTTAQLRARVETAQARARVRAGCLNADVPDRWLDEVAPITDRAAALLVDLVARGVLSGRGVARIRRVARTIADLASADDGAADVGDALDDHAVALALSLRAPTVVDELEVAS